MELPVRAGGGGEGPTPFLNSTPTSSPTSGPSLTPFLQFTLIHALGLSGSLSQGSREDQRALLPHPPGPLRPAIPTVLFPKKRFLLSLVHKQYFTLSLGPGTPGWRLVPRRASRGGSLCGWGVGVKVQGRGLASPHPLRISLSCLGLSFLIGPWGLGGTIGYLRVLGKSRPSTRPDFRAVA